MRKLYSTRVPRRSRVASRRVPRCEAGYAVLDAAAKAPPDASRRGTLAALIVACVLAAAVVAAWLASSPAEPGPPTPATSDGKPLGAVPLRGRHELGRDEIPKPRPEITDDGPYFPTHDLTIDDASTPPGKAPAGK